MFVLSRDLPDPHDPFRPPDRRRLRCLYLLEHGRRPSPARDDAATHEAWRFFRLLGSRRTDDDRERLARRFPAVAEAHQYFADAPPLARAEVEARLLAGEADEAIAGKTGLSPAGVHAYAGLYYDVRPFLQAEMYILTVVLGGAALHATRPDDHATLLRLFGFTMGGAAVDDLIDYILHPPVLPASLKELDHAGLKRLRDRVALRVLILTLVQPGAKGRVATWLRLRERLDAACDATWHGGGVAELPASLRAAAEAASRRADGARAASGAEEAVEAYRAHLAGRRPCTPAAGSLRTVQEQAVA